MEDQKSLVLIVDDEPQIRLLLREFLSGQFETDFAANGREAVRKSEELRPDVILMDVMMPDLDGISAVQKIRENALTRHIPILMLTAANTARYRIEAFDLGADDFITKPFEVEELLSRIRSKLVRARQLRDAPPNKTGFSNLEFDGRAREVRIDGVLLDLGPVEFGILELLLSRPGSVVKRKEIMDRVWGDREKNDRLIDAHLTSLRKKLSGLQADLETVYGRGYRLKARS
jgi:DNA-binding response OmpR family regulator